MIVVVLAALAAGWYVHGRGDRPGSQRWVTGAGTDRGSIFRQSAERRRRCVPAMSTS